MTRRMGSYDNYSPVHISVSIIGKYWTFNIHLVQRPYFNLLIETSLAYCSLPIKLRVKLKLRSRCIFACKSNASPIVSRISKRLSLFFFLHFVSCILHSWLEFNQKTAFVYYLQIVSTILRSSRISKRLSAFPFFYYKITLILFSSFRKIPSNPLSIHKHIIHTLLESKTKTFYHWIVTWP